MGKHNPRHVVLAQKLLLEKENKMIVVFGFIVKIKISNNFTQMSLRAVLFSLSIYGMTVAWNAKPRWKRTAVTHSELLCGTYPEFPMLEPTCR